MNETGGPTATAVMLSITGQVVGVWKCLPSKEEAEAECDEFSMPIEKCTLS